MTSGVRCRAARPARDRALAAVALGAVLAVAAARTRDLAPLATPASFALLAIYLVTRIARARPRGCKLCAAGSRGSERDRASTGGVILDG